MKDPKFDVAENLVLAFSVHTASVCRWGTAALLALQEILWKGVRNNGQDHWNKSGA